MGRSSAATWTCARKRHHGAGVMRGMRRHLALALLSAVLLAGIVAACSQPDRLKARCLSGDLNRCTQLGEMYATGTGVPRNMVRAAEMYERACAGGATDVCNTLGEIYEKSGSFEGGVARAEQMYEKACNGGSSAGCLNLGLAFAAREDHVRALALFDRSCNGGWAPGCHQLATSYLQGEGARKDVAKALALFSQACDGENIDSCTTAAEIYVRGEEAPRDITAAVALYGKAVKVLDLGCQAGSDRDCNERERLKTRVTLISGGGK